MLDAVVKIRVSKEEHKDWQNKSDSSGESISSLIRQSMKRIKTWTAKDRTVEQERNRQFARIGNNLNQIAKWANTHKEAADAIQVIAHLRAIEEHLIKLEPKK